MQRWSTAGAVAAAVVLLGLVAPARPQPEGALVALLLDSSGSLAPRDLDRARQLALEVLRTLPAGSEVAVFTFDDQSRLVLPRTSGADEVQRALTGVRISGRHTALHDALYDASRYLRESGAARTAILLITDGKDEQSALDLDDGLRLAQDARIPVFAVGVGQVEERGLRRIAKLTGGQYRAAREASGAELVAAMMAAAPSAAPAAGPPSPPVATARVPPPAAAATERAQEPATAGSRTLLPLVIAAVGLAALGLLLLLRRRRSRPPGTGAALSSTMVSRLGGTTEEYLEKTVVLREKAVLAVTRGPLAGQVFDLSPASATSLGRSKANDLVLDDVSVSSQHCRIRPDDGAFTLLDLKSTNGTFVNERRVTSHQLAEGDVIRVGEVQLQFRTDQRRG
jgi:MYXO-CTERM domain-containing protein